MDTRDFLMEDKHFLIQALAGLVEIEQQRIVKCGIATKSQLNSLSDVAEYLVDMAKKRKRTNVPLNALANLCTMLKSIQLPGDFEEFTIGASHHDLGEKFYIALDLPYEGEQFYDLSSVLKGKEESKGDEDKHEKKLKCGCEPGGCAPDADHDCGCPSDCECRVPEDHLDDCVCMDCTANTKHQIWARKPPGRPDPGVLMRA